VVYLAFSAFPAYLIFWLLDFYYFSAIFQSFLNQNLAYPKETQLLAHLITFCEPWERQTPCFGYFLLESHITSNNSDTSYPNQQKFVLFYSLSHFC